MTAHFFPVRKSNETFVLDIIAQVQGEFDVHIPSTIIRREISQLCGSAANRKQSEIFKLLKRN